MYRPTPRREFARDREAGRVPTLRPALISHQPEDLWEGDSLPATPAHNCRSAFARGEPDRATSRSKTESPACGRYTRAVRRAHVVVCGRVVRRALTESCRRSKRFDRASRRPLRSRMWRGHASESALVVNAALGAAVERPIDAPDRRALMPQFPATANVFVVVERAARDGAVEMHDQRAGT